MEVDLVGYLLGSLDAQEHEEIRLLLERDPELRAACGRLMQHLRVLRADAGDFAPPADLAERTCRFVADYEAPTPAATSAGGVSQRGWRMADLFTSAGVLAAVTLLFFPAIATSRFQARRLHCENNLMQMGMSLSNYSQQYGGFFPYVSADSRLSAAGIYAPLLRDNGYVEDDQLFYCPAGSGVDGQLAVPSLAELRRAHGSELARLRALMGGNYGYSLGYCRSGEYCGVRDRGRPHFAIMADAPAAESVQHRSLNHGGQGQNVLYEDGHVAYREKCTEDCGDNVFLSQRGYVEAGLNESDAVIGSSGSRPRLFFAVPAP